MKKAIKRMTKPEITGKRDLKFSGWIRKNLPDSYTGFLVSDLDFILYSRQSKQIMWIEVKTRNKEISDWQKKLFVDLAKCLRCGMREFMPDWRFAGFHVVKFENTFFDDGNTFFDNREITEKQLVEKLSLLGRA